MRLFKNVRRGVAADIPYLLPLCVMVRSTTRRLLAHRDVGVAHRSRLQCSPASPFVLQCYLYARIFCFHTSQTLREAFGCACLQLGFEIAKQPCERRRTNIKTTPSTAVRRTAQI